MNTNTEMSTIANIQSPDRVTCCQTCFPTQSPSLSHTHTHTHTHKGPLGINTFPPHVWTRTAVSAGPQKTNPEMTNRETERERERERERQRQRDRERDSERERACGLIYFVFVS